MNTLQISITAADKATRTIQKINKQVDQMVRPFQNVQRSIQRFAHAAGFDAVKKKLEGLTTTARGVVGAFARIGAPLLALVGGGTIAGLLALTSGWARFGLTLSQTAQIYDVNAQKLYDFQNAARLVGISGEAATQAFTSFADTLQDARWGRNQQVMGLLIDLGIQLKTTKSGSIDAMQALGDVAEKIHRFQQQGNAGAARTLASQLGLTSLLPVLMQGRKALEDYEAQAQKLTGAMDWSTAAAAAMQWNRLDIAMSGLKNTIAAALLPTITPLVEQFGAWITANRTLVATDIGDFIKGLGAAFKGISLKNVLDDILAVVNGFLKLGTEVAHVTGELGGVKSVLEDLAGLWVASKVLEYGSAFVKASLWIEAARKSLLAWKTASVAAEGASIGTRAATVAAGGLRAASLASMAVPAVGIGLLVNELWNGKMGKLDFNSWSGLFNSMKSDKTHQKQVMGFFQSKGWTAAQAAGITANIQTESGYDPRAISDNGAAQGIGQWHQDRQDAFNAWARKNRLPDLENADLMEQLQYYEYELRQTDAGRRLAGAKNANEAGRIVSLYDERPADAEGEATRRGALATQIAGPEAPAINVSVQTHVQKDGTTTTKVQTPAGVKIVHTSPPDSVS